MLLADAMSSILQKTAYRTQKHKMGGDEYVLLLNKYDLFVISIQPFFIPFRH